MSWIDRFPQQLAELEDRYLRRVRRPVRPGASASGIHLTVNGQPMLAFCSNDYLGLAQDDRLKAVAGQASRSLGVGSGASALVSGYGAGDADLEQALARHVGMPAALYFGSGYMANAGVIPALIGKGDALFSDQLNHASIIDGCRLSGAELHRYPHADLKALEHLLANSRHERKLIVTDAVFSMDGNLADLPELLRLAEQHDALVLIDDAHGFGVLGGRGQGSLAHWGLLDAQGQVAVPVQNRLLYLATLGKAAGVMGAFVAGRTDLVEWLVQKSRTYIFATAPPPALALTLQESLRLMAGEPWRRARLSDLIARLRTGIEQLCADQPELGWRLPHSDTPIQPLVIGGNADALRVMEHLRDQGLWVPAIRPPTVPEGTTRLRITLSAAHQPGHVDRLLAALAEAGRAMHKQATSA